MYRALLCLGLACAGLLTSPPAEAGPGAETYFFDLVDFVAKADGVPAELVEQTRKAIATELARRPEIISQLPEAAPDPEASPEKFKRWLLRRNMRAFKVAVEITAYKQATEAPSDRDKRLKVHVALHMFGETLPQRSFGFTGDGSATIVLEVGSTVRERDQTVARTDALELASQKAIAESVTQLRAANKVKKNKRRRKKRKRAAPSAAPAH